MDLLRIDAVGYQGLNDSVIRGGEEEAAAAALAGALVDDGEFMRVLRLIIHSLKVEDVARDLTTWASHLGAVDEAGSLLRGASYGFVGFLGFAEREISSCHGCG